MKKLFFTSLFFGSLALGSGYFGGGGAGGSSIGGDITGATGGSVLFADPDAVINQDNSNLFFDNANNRLGIGNATPAHPLDVTGVIRGSSAPIFTNFGTAGVIHNNASGVFSSSTIVNADVNAAAAIAYSKLDLGTSIVNADVAAAAAIATTKLAALTADRAVITNGSGFLAVSATSAAELAFVDGVTSAIQTQLDAKLGYTVPTANSTYLHTTALGSPSGSANTLLGMIAGQNLTSGLGNVGVGYNVMANASSADSNVAINGLFALTTGDDNVGISGGAGLQGGGKNTAVGSVSLNDNVSGNNNVAVGYEALRTSTQSAQTAVGYQALALALGATANTCVGFQTCDAITSGSNNTALGNLALSGNQTSNNNVAVGDSVLFAVTGAGNTAIGQNACSALTTGSSNICIGRGSAASAVGASNEMIIGSTAANINDVYLGRGVSASAANQGALVLQVTGATGSDVAATTSVFNIAGGRGTGTGAGGDVRIQTAPAGSSAATQNALVTRLSVESNGDVNIHGTTSGQIGLKAGASPSSYDLTLPSAQGAANSYLQNNGSGTLSWVAGTTTFATSAAEDAVGSGNYMAFTGANGSVSLVSGTYDVDGYIEMIRGGGASSLLSLAAYWTSAAGADTTTQPTLISATANCTLTWGRDLAYNFLLNAVENVDGLKMPVAPIRITLTATTSVYLVPYNTSSAGSWNIRVGVRAKRVYE